MIDTWFIGLKESGYSNQTCNHILSNIRNILGEAVRVGHIAINPATSVKPLSKESKTRGILAEEEVRTLLHPNTWVNYWPTITEYLANLTAATTGLRMGEIQALRWQDLYPEVNPDRINVKHSWDRRHGIKGTKTSKDRIVPLPRLLKTQLLRFRCGAGPEAFIFSNDHGKTPINDSCLLDSLYQAFEKIGIDEKSRKERWLTFHGWRHYFNTFLRRQGVQDSKLQMVTGHSTTEMTDHYTHYNIEDMKEIMDAQSAILGPIDHTRHPKSSQP